MIRIEHLLFAVALLLLVAVLISKLSARVSIPPQLLVLVLGMLIGSDGPGGIYFNDPWIAQLIGTTALALILFSGGLDTDWPSVRPMLGQGIMLSTVGVLISTALVGWIATLVFRLSWGEGLLLGAILSATDAAAVFALLHASNLRLENRLLSLLELESCTNDPMAVFLTIGLTLLVSDPHTSIPHLVPLFVEQMGIGAVVGLLGGLVMVWLVNRIELQVTGLYPVLTTALVLLTYGSAASLDGSGFLAVYLAGLVVGNRQVAERASLTLFHSALASLLEIAMFLTLGLLVFPSHLPAIAGASLVITLFLIFVARPASVFLCLLPARRPMREQAFVSWVGLRGAVPIVLATFPLLAGVAHASLIFDVVFFTVLVSVLAQGMSVARVARWLHVTVPSATPAGESAPT